MRHSQSDDNDLDASLSDFNNMNLDATHLISETRHPKEASFIKKVELKPTEQQRISLGNFKEDNPPKAFRLRLRLIPTPQTRF